MHDDIYPMRPKRRVVEPKEFEDQIFEAYRQMSDDCIEKAITLCRELESYDPDADEFCGILDDRFAVYASRIERCATHMFVISLDLKNTKGPAMAHGPITKAKACKSAMRLVTRHRKLINPIWDPRKGKDQ